jgi:hypothetical protein
MALEGAVQEGRSACGGHAVNSGDIGVIINMRIIFLALERLIKTRFRATRSLSRCTIEIHPVCQHTRIFVYHSPPPTLPSQP